MDNAELNRVTTAGILRFGDRDYGAGHDASTVKSSNNQLHFESLSYTVIATGFGVDIDAISVRGPLSYTSGDIGTFLTAGNLNLGVVSFTESDDGPSTVDVPCYSSIYIMRPGLN